MKTIQNISTSEIERIQRRFERPTSLTETIIAKGLEAELAERRAFPLGGSWPEHLAEKNDRISELQDKVDSYLSQDDEEEPSVEARVEEALETPTAR